MYPKPVSSRAKIQESTIDHYLEFWKAHNYCIFDDINASPYNVSIRVISSLNDFGYYKQSSKQWVISLLEVSEGITTEFFDGVA